MPEEFNVRLADHISFAEVPKCVGTASFLELDKDREYRVLFVDNARSQQFREPVSKARLGEIWGRWKKHYGVIPVVYVTELIPAKSVSGEGRADA